MSGDAYAGPGRRAELSPGRGRTAAFVVYLLFIAGPFTGGIAALVGWIVTLAARADADAQPLDHMRRQARMFWTALILLIPVVILSLIGEIPILGIPFAVVGWVLGFLIAAWFVISSFFGLLRLQQGRPTRG